MLKKLKNDLKRKLEKIDRTEIVDILMFGSAVKGEPFPNDIDLCIIFRGKINNEMLADISKRLKTFNVHISSLSIDDFFKKPHSLIKTLLVEGISILTGKSLSENFGFRPYALYSYNLSGIKSSHKVKFVYLVKGRNSKGFVEKLNGLWIADSCFMIPIEHDKEILTMFRKWVVPFIRKEMLVH